MAETCRHRQTNKLRYLDSCVLMDLPTPHPHSTLTPGPSQSSINFITSFLTLSSHYVQVSQMVFSLKHCKQKFFILSYHSHPPHDKP